MANPFFVIFFFNLKVLIGGTNAYPMLWRLCSDYEAETLGTVNEVPPVLSVLEITCSKRQSESKPDFDYLQNFLNLFNEGEQKREKYQK